MEQKLTTAEILNQILPPKEFVQSGTHVKQYVSSTEASRVDVARLREMLDHKLLERQAREKPICPVREELFQQCLEEIIRQVTIGDNNRGLLLMRVRDEIKQSIESYKTLYKSSENFAMRKQLHAEHGKPELLKRIDEMTVRKTELENEVLRLKNKIKAREDRNAERLVVDEARRAKELKF
jgi:dynein light intermediate chain